MLDQINKYRQLVTLNDGARALLRPLANDDRDALISLFAPLPDDEVRFFYDDVRDRELVGAWADGLDYAKVLPIVAVVNGRIVGDSILRFQVGPERHIARVRIFISREFRRRGLGTAMLRAIIDVGRKCGLQQLQAEVPSSHVKVIAAFKHLGFQHCATFPDHFITQDGETHDIDVLFMPLRPHTDEF